MIKTSRRDQRYLSAWLIAIFLAGFLAQLDIIATGTLRDYIDLVVDDANYYLGVASNLGSGLGSKFAEPLETNGYQPLWAWLLTAFVRLGAQSKTSLLITVLSISFVLKAAGVYLFGNEEADSKRRLSAKLALFVAIGLFKFVFSMGMETTLFVVVLPLLLRHAKVVSWPRRHALLVGSLAAVCFLVRLDAAAVYVAVLTVRWFEGNLRKTDAWSFIPLFLTVLVYCSLNEVAFGTALPISGQAKAVGLIIGGNLKTSVSFIAPLGWALVSLLSFAALRFAGTRVPGSRFEIDSLSLAVALGAFYYGTFSNYSVWPWYFYTIAFLTTYVLKDAFIALVTAVQSRSWRRGRVQNLAVCGTSIALGVALINGTAYPTNGWLVPRHVLAQLGIKGQGQAPETFNTRSADFIEWLDKNYSSGVTIAMGDRAGGLGYWLDRRYGFIQLEGLVGNRALLSSLANGTLDQFAESQKVALYVVDRHGALTMNGIDGFIEPVQPRVSRAKLNIFCFKQGAALLDRNYRWGKGGSEQIWRVYDFRNRTACPPAMLQQAALLQREFDGVRRL